MVILVGDRFHMSDILFAYDTLIDGDLYTSHGVKIEGGYLSDPIENCIDFVFKRENWPLCDCGNFFLGMFQKVWKIRGASPMRIITRTDGVYAG